VNTRTFTTTTPAELDAAVAEAVACLRAGDPVALPTETVYGLAADALRPEAVLKIFEAKERPFFDPLICHLPDRDWLERMTAIPEEGRALVDALIAKFWPGPLTLVLPRREIVPDLVTSGLPTVAVRMPAHPVFRAVLSGFGQPLAAPSANRFGRISPTAAAHVETELAGRIPLILDGGPTEHGLESTIVKVEGTRMIVLRTGPVTLDELVLLWRDWRMTMEPSPDEAEITRMYADLGVDFAKVFKGQPDAAIEAPGQIKSHYAPRTPLRMLEFNDYPVNVVEMTWRPDSMRVGLLGWARVIGEDYARFALVEWLSETCDLREAAATLFAKMRRLDEAGLDLILAEPVPEHGLGIAIMDRLRKAAAEHVH
jgi:L-threonylcarbamoyladenylate synthase